MPVVFYLRSVRYVKTYIGKDIHNFVFNYRNRVARPDRRRGRRTTQVAVYTFAFTVFFQTLAPFLYFGFYFLFELIHYLPKSLFLLLRHLFKSGKKVVEHPFFTEVLNAELFKFFLSFRAKIFYLSNMLFYFINNHTVIRFLFCFSQDAKV